MIRDIRLAVALAGFLMLVATGAAAQTEGLYMGQLVLQPTCPRWTLEADGRTLPIKTNQAMFAILGTAFGGDGKNDFALPDLRGKAGIAGYRYCMVNNAQFPSRE